jgi:hypothetical protein
MKNWGPFVLGSEFVIARIASGGSRTRRWGVRRDRSPSRASCALWGSLRHGQRRILLSSLRSAPIGANEDPLFLDQQRETRELLDSLHPARTLQPVNQLSVGTALRLSHQELMDRIFYRQRGILLPFVLVLCPVIPASIGGCSGSDLRARRQTSLRGQTQKTQRRRSCRARSSSIWSAGIKILLSYFLCFLPTQAWVCFWT